jgi:luciferase-like monooxygenase
MRIGIGLPTTIPGVKGSEVTEWARRADAAGFSTLGTIRSHRLPQLRAVHRAGGRGRRDGTDQPDHGDRHPALPPELGARKPSRRQRFTNSGARLVLGAAVGGRPDDFEAAGVPFEGRGRRFEEMLDDIKRVWAGEERGSPARSARMCQRARRR